MICCFVHEQPLNHLGRMWYWHSQQVAGQTLSVLFKLMILVGATIAAFGQGYAQLLLHIYGGRRPLRVPST